MVVIILAGILGGRKIDEKMQMKTPWFTLLFSILSVSLAMYVVIRDFTKK